MKTFENCIDFIENKLGVHLFDCQKDVLKKLYENDNYTIVYARHSGKMILRYAIMLMEIYKKENEL
jgi:hypothetical protein